ncbi:hypothetical protein ALQ75_05447 [Pseudomonas savastanoi pv. glycinea]|nr:hypothetical protein ALQ75_05447 [Pseudomonas savastanoi pv. glycinea]
MCPQLRSDMHRQAVRKQQIDETFGGGLWFMVGKAHAFIGFDEHVLGLIGGRHHQVQADDRDVQSPRCTYCCIAEHRVQNGRDIFKAATGVQVCSAAHGQTLIHRQDIGILKTGLAHCALGLLVHRNTAFAISRGGTATALGLDQLFDGMASITNDLSRTTDRCSHHLKADHHDAQVEAFMKAFQNDARVELTGLFDSALNVFDGPQIDGDTLALLAIQRLDHDLPVLFKKRKVVVCTACPLLCGQAQAGSLQRSMGQAFVLTQGHAHRAGQIAQRLAAADPPTTIAEGKQAGIRVIHLYINATTMGFLDDDSRIWIEIRLRTGAEEQRLIDAVLALDGEGRQVTEIQLGVQRLGLIVVMQYRQIKVAQTAAHEVLDQMPHQHFTHAGPRALRVNRQAPEAAAFFRVIEGFLMVKAHDAADDRVAALIFGHPIYRATFMARREQGRVDGQHAACQIQVIDGLPVRFVMRPADAIPAKHPVRRSVVAEPQTKRVRRVEKQLLRRLRQYLLRRRHIQGNVTLAGLFVEQVLGQCCRIRVSVTDQQATPATMQRQRLCVYLAAIFGKTRLQTFVRGRLATQQALAISRRVLFHQSQSLFAEPQVQRCQLPQLGAAQWRELALWVGQQLIDHGRIEQAAVLTGVGQQFTHPVKGVALQVLEAGNREVALLAVDHFRRNDQTRRFFQHLLAAIRQFELARNTRRQLNQPVVKERCTRFQAPGHGHVVDSFDRVIDQHHRTVQAQRLVDRRAGTGLGEMIANEITGCVVGCAPLRLHRLGIFRIAAVDKRIAVGRNRVARAVYLWVPVVTGKQLVSALAALYHLAMLGHFTRQQVEGDTVVADHRLAHGAERRRQLFDDLAFLNTQLVVACAVMLGDQVGILKFISTLATGILKADREGRQVFDPHFTQQADQHAGVDTAGKQHADVYRGTLTNRHCFTGAVQYAVAPVFEREVFLVFMRTVRQGPPDFLLDLAAGVDAHPAGWRQLLDARQQRARGRHHSVEVEVMVERHRIKHSADITTLEQGWQRRREAQALVGF